MQAKRSDYFKSVFGLIVCRIFSEAFRVMHPVQVSGRMSIFTAFTFDF